MLAPQAATRTGDDRHLAVETEIRHRHSTPSLLLTADTVAVSGPRTPCRASLQDSAVCERCGRRVTGVSRSSTWRRVAPAHATDPVRVRVRSCGICASDLHLAAWNLPVTLGHEFAGVLDDGTAVAVQPNAWCGDATAAWRARRSCAATAPAVCTASRSTADWPTRWSSTASASCRSRPAWIPRSARWSSRWRWASTPPAVLRSNQATGCW